jgi:hypothetical protein
MTSKVIIGMLQFNAFLERMKNVPLCEYGEDGELKNVLFGAHPFIIE